MPKSIFTPQLLQNTIVIALLFSAACASPPSTATPTPPPALTETLSPTRTAALSPSPPETYTPSPSPTRTIPVTAEPLSSVGYNLPLTIQHTAETSATLFFELDTPSEGRLRYWSFGEEDQQTTIPFSADQTRHQITLEGLLPGTDYQAQVELSAGAGRYKEPHFMGGEWGAVSFHTPSGQLPLRVGVIGDSGLGEPVTLALTVGMAAYDLDFVLHTGDVVYLMEQNSTPFEAFGLKYYATFAPLLHEMPVYTVVGNHDHNWAALWQDAPFYYYAFPPFPSPGFEASDFQGQNQWYAVAYGEFQFLLLDTQTFFGEEGREEQNAWVAERLADDRFSYTIPVFHVPPYSSSEHASEGLVVRQAWEELFAQANVPVVFSGHDHTYERLSVEGITYLVSGGGCSILYNLVQQREESQFFARRNHFVILEIYADRIELQAIALDGEVMDEVTIPLE